MTATLAGFVWGVVTDNNDPKKAGRVKFRIPGVYTKEGPDWAIPVGWPGAGGTTQGSFFTVPIGAQIALIFEQGNMHSSPAFLPGPYGQDKSGLPAGPPKISQLASEAGFDPREFAIIWEDENFVIFAQNSASQKRLVFEEKRTGAFFSMDAADGTEGKSASISISGTTAVNIDCEGIVSVNGSVVQVQNRRVAKKRRGTTI